MTQTTSSRLASLSTIMNRAWMLVKKYGFNMAEALRKSWAIAKLRASMKKGIVKFMFTKLDGSIRTAWGTLKEGIIGETTGSGRKPNESLCTYWDTEKQSYRSFKIANFIG